MKTLYIAIISAFLIIPFQSCKRVGCMANVDCVDDYDPKAEKAGDCTGCTDITAANYCPEATVDNNNCQFRREFYTNNEGEGWVDVWVADSADVSDDQALVYEGRLTLFPRNIPECENGDSTMTIIRLPGEYYYEIETQTGYTDWGWAKYREEGCRLLDIY
ncbi:MAG: hypothetical protein HN542_08455 [Flavobacteriales bacterium]|jgi:hypothetical protein|nr:hypothetical protein [Flavobacteriales bacterium]NCG30033.1 hypothetical protein [Bacteroidota bacterium]MBT3962981.1 hypothetical protein [Flavobacteriales bacterium]MBT4705598.1 hypothetical protein [Flavobacteriales bacterium]MBT4931137.1 hypothetical protein [Flavobacteriales bacterium]